MKILDFCDPDVAAVPLDANVAEAIQLMLRWHVGAVAVVVGNLIADILYTVVDPRIKAE